MRALKVLVIAMGVVLAGGTAALVMAVVNRMEERRAALPPTPAPGAAPRHLALPAGARIVATELSGDRLLVRVALAEGGEELWLIDARTGTLIATVAASTKP